MARHVVGWGEGELSLPLPEHWVVTQVARPSVPAAGADWIDRLAVALTRPEGAPPLGRMLRGLPPHARVVLIVEDATRHSPLADILPVLVRELDHAGVADEQVEILLATGMRSPMTSREVAAKLGPLADRFVWRCNAATDSAAHAYVGDVLDPGGGRALPIFVDRRCLEADLRIVVTAVTPHLQAGFGGGAKMLVPGCAAIETISRLHNAGLSAAGRYSAVGPKPATNPMRRMIDAAGDLIENRHGRTFGVQYLLDAADRPSAIATGDLRRGHQMLAKQCAAASGVIVESPADLVIVNAGPRDYDMWQAFKCIVNACQAVRPNGVICVLARCPAGLNTGHIRWPLSPMWTRRIVRWIGPAGLVSMVRRMMPTVDPEAHFVIRLAIQTLHRNPILMYAPAIVSRGQRFPGLPLYSDLGAMFTAADRWLDSGSRRVILFPEGGASYPIG